MRLEPKIFGLLAVFFSLVGCSSSLPTLETAPEGSGPTVKDVVSHIQCELSSIVNAGAHGSWGDSNYRLNKRLDAMEKDHAGSSAAMKELLDKLNDYHFVAAVQVSLEVTNNEGLNPTVSIIRPNGKHAIGVGGQMTGTQDRNISMSYAIDLSQLKGKARQEICGPAAEASGLITTISRGDTIGGDLGFADIVVDGLTMLNETQRYNIYSTTPTPIPVSKAITLKSPSQDVKGLPIKLSTGTLATLYGSVKIKSFDGAMLFSPQAAASATPGSVTFNGQLTVESDVAQDAIPAAAATPAVPAVALPGVSDITYIASLTGSAIPPSEELAPGHYVNFTLTGSLTPLSMPQAHLSSQFVTTFGVSPTISLVGKLPIGSMKGGGTCYSFGEMTLSGLLTAATGGTAQLPVSVNFPADKTLSDKNCTPAPPKKMNEFAMALGKGKVGGGSTTSSGGTASASSAGSGGGKASTGSAGGGTAFGSLITFTVVEGLNGGPTWAFSTFTGAGTSPLSVSRTYTDSVTISFVPACQDAQKASPATTSTNYWDTLPACDQFGNSVAQASGFANNNSILLYKFGLSGGNPPK